MKTWLWLPLACLLGFVVGSWGARDELQAFKSRAIKEHTKEASGKSIGKQGGFDAFARMMQIPETAHRRRFGRNQATKVKPSVPAATNAVAARAKGKVAHLPAETNVPPARLSPEDLRARIEEAQELWRTRVDMVRAQWKKKLKLEGETERAFDAAVQEMNERLYDSVSALAGILSEKDQMTPELGLRLVGETATILSETYDKIGACASPELRDEISTMQMVDFIDPGVAQPLVNVQGKLEGLAGGGRNGR